MPIAGPPLAGPVALDEILARGLETKPDAEALVSRRQRFSWVDLDRLSSRLAAGYLGLGLQRGDRIASLMPNRAELLVHYLACMRAGLVAMPLNYRYMAPEVDHALEVGGARALLMHGERSRDLAGSRLVSELPLGIIRYADEGAAGDPSFSSLIESGADLDAAPRASADPAILFFTSGSTGKPKAVCHSFETLGWIVASAVESFRMTPGDVMVPGGSISHVGGHHLSLMTLAAAGKVVLPRTFDGGEILPLLREERPTKLWMLPSALYALVRDHDARRGDFASIEACWSGGDKVSSALEREFTGLTGVAIDEDYGMTEIGISNVTPPDSLRIGSIGPLAPGYEASLRDGAGAEVEPGGDGRLWIRFPGNMVGYWENPAATAEATDGDGWLDTGDVMAADGDGWLWFHGREKQIIVHDGSNICPQEVEAALLEHPAVAVAGVVGVQSPLHGENVRAYVALEPDAEPPTMEELIHLARERVGYKAPEEVLVLERMPLNATGKVDRVALKQRALSPS